LLLGLFSLVTPWATDLAARTGKLAVLGTAWHLRIFMLRNVLLLRRLRQGPAQG
jgi:hypothetical protein